METYFLRFTQNPEQDIERGTSAHYSDLKVNETDQENAASLFGAEVEEIQDIEGYWCHVLDGLCGFQLQADTLEAAIEEVKDFEHNSVYSMQTMGDIATIFSGVYSNEVPEGCVFYPKKLEWKAQ